LTAALNSSSCLSSLRSGCVDPWLMPLLCDSPLVTSRRAALACLQNRLNELGENFAIEIREW
jgi:hypothetical protein